MTTAGIGDFVHDALFYRTDGELIAAVAPFLRAGLAAHDAIVLACSDRNTALLSEEIGSIPRIRCIERAEFYRRPAKTISECQKVVAAEVAAGARRVRLVGEVDFGLGPEDWLEWARFEAVVNRALAPYPLWSVCVYDTRRLPDEVLVAGRLTHPYLLTAQSRVPNPRYVAPAEYLRRSAQTGSDPLEADQPELEVIDPIDLALLRHNLRRIAVERSALARDKVEGFIFAVNEVTTNALMHGCPPVRVRLWSTPTRLYCAVSDHGTGFDDPFAGYLPSDSADLWRGRWGLRLARHYCDHLDVSWSSDVFTVRVATGS